MTEKEWNEAIERSIQGEPASPVYEAGLKKDGTITFRGWIARIGGVFPSNLAVTGGLPPSGIDLNDIQYFGILRRIVKDKMYVAMVPGDYAAQAIPGQSFEVKDEGFKIGQFKQDDVDAAVAAAEKKLIEISTLDLDESVSA